MKKKYFSSLIVLLMAFLILASGVFISGCSKSTKANSNSAAGIDEKKKKELDEVAFFAAKCGFCHDLDRIEKSKYRGDQWENVLKRMYQYDNGANLTKDDYQVILNYLKKTYK